MEFYIGRFKGIERKTYELEVVTPMFLGGADPKDVELRIPPIKGMLRFWWRALHPDLANNNYDNLRKGESGLFGDAGGTYGKSSVKIQFSDIYNLPHSKFRPLPHSDVKKSVQFEGFNPASDSKFKIIVTGPENIHKLFEFSTIVGGLGKRNRRGFGSLLIKKEKQNGNSSIIDTLYNLINEINPNSYKKCNENCLEISQPYSDKIDYPYLKKIQIGKENLDYNSLLKTIGESSHKNKSDYTGFVEGQKRFSSPLYVSITKHGSNYVPIISMLNVSFDPETQREHKIDKTQFFINDIMNKGIN